MDFIYKYGRLPGDRELEAGVSAAAARLAEKLSEMDVNSLDISDYNKRYFSTLRSEMSSALHKLTYILLWALQDRNVSLEKQVMMEYGGGPGLQSLLAKEMGIGTVLYTDIYDVSCKDAKTIADHLGMTADAYILGDIDEVIDYVKEHNLDCNAVMSNDVIEHIYDMDSYLRKVPLLSNGAMSLAMLTTANMLNVKNVKKVMKKQHARENLGKEVEYGHKERDATEAYLNIRNNIIKEYAPELAEDIVAQLARNTRGLMIDDIKAAVDKYRESGVIIEAITHPTNTCDPYTGNWCEHLMDPFELRKLLEMRGFRSSIQPGYYYVDESQGVTEKIARTLMNLVIRASGRLGLRIAPMWLLYAHRS